MFVIYLVTITHISYSQNNHTHLVISLNDSIEKNNKERVNSDGREKVRELSVDYLLFPNASQNYTRFELISDHTEKHGTQLQFNSAIQQYISADPNFNNLLSIGEQVDYIQKQLEKPALNVESEGLVNSFDDSFKDAYYGTLRANLVAVNSESEMAELVAQSTREMMNNNMDDLSNGLLPFVTMLMNEQHFYNYDRDRAKSKPSAMGIITAVQMLNTMGTLDINNKAGVCRDTHDMGLRVLRNMYRVYLDEKYPGNHYQVDDYIFLQAWVTHTSQHVTLVVIDPENPRNFHELDWGRVIKKTDQEGIEIGKMNGTAIRLWQFDENKDVSTAFNLVRSQWGAFFDKELLNSDEQWQINGIYSPQYSSSASYRFNVGKKGKVIFSSGAMSAKERFLSGTIRSGKHHGSITRFLDYDGFSSWQSMYVDDTYRRTKTMLWSNWGSASNLISSVRYISGLKTKALNLTPNLQFYLFAKSQLEAFLTLSHFESDDSEFHEDGLYRSGDGNVWTTWGAELTYQNNSKNFNATLNYIDRSFLIPTDVRLLSPNPIVLLENATAVSSGQGSQLKAGFDFPKGNVAIDTRFEQDALKSKFIYGSVEYNTSLTKRPQFFAKIGYFTQVFGIGYYWYAKDRFWVNSGFNLLEQKASFSLFTQDIDGNDFSVGVSLSKSF
jgi:hypothetical protein